MPLKNGGRYGCLMVTSRAILVATVTVTDTGVFGVTFAGLGATEQVEFIGAPVQVKLTAPLNPLVPATVKL